MDAVKETQSQAPVEAGPPPSVALLQLTTGTMVTQAVSVVARLGVADALAGGPKSCEDIAASVDADAPTLYRLLRAVADRGVVIHLDDDRFELTPVGELLRTDVHGSLRAWATMAGLPFHRDAWTDLYASVRTGEPAFARLHGTDLFGYLAGHPDDAAVFDAAMTSVSLSMLAGIVHAYDFGRFSTASPATPRRNPPLITLAPQRLLSRLAEEYIFAQLCEAIMLSFAAENEARMRAMIAARTNVHTDSRH